MKISNNTLTGQLQTDTTWQKLDLSRSLDQFIIYVEGDEIYLYIGDNPVALDAFKVPTGAALEWPATVHDVWVRGVDTSTIVYYIA